MSQRFSCSRDASERQEPLFGTASQVRRWILLEQDGPWGRDAVLESRLDPTVARALVVMARRLAARLVLIRRRGGPVSDGATAYVAVTAERGSWVEELSLDAPAALLDTDLDGLASGDSVAGRRLEGPLYLVCTNGRHDPCCAEFGRPVVRALGTVAPASTWECSHIGGDRFAANVLCLPEGVYYGRVGPLEAGRVAAAHGHGRLVLDHYRGRSCHPFTIQAADYLLRRELDLDGIGDLLAIQARRDEGSGAVVVTFESADGWRHVVGLGVAVDEQPQRLTCHARSMSRPPRYVLRSHVAEPPHPPRPRP